MEVPVNLKSSALIVLDWQRFFVSPDSPAGLSETGRTEGAIEALVAAFLSSGKPVAATRHVHSEWDRGPFQRFYGRLLLADDPLSELAPLLRGRDGVTVLKKNTYSVFASTDLEVRLRTARADTVLLAGCQTDKCVVANALSAFDLGFDVIVAEDACAARSAERHEAALALLRRSCARVLPTAEILRGPLR